MSEALLRFAEISLGQGGLPSCRHCGPADEAETRPGSEIIGDVLDTVERWDRVLLGPGPNLAFVGAEPFSHAELPGIVFAASEAGASRVGLRTGGEALSVGENAAGILHAGVRRIELVVLAGVAAHADLAGRPGSSGAVSHGMSLLRRAADEQAARVALCALVPVCHHNLEHLPGAIAGLVEIGVREVTLDVSASAASSVEAGGWISSACDTGIVNGTWVSVRSPLPVNGVPALHFMAATGPVAFAGSGGPTPGTSRPHPASGGQGA